MARNLTCIPLALTTAAGNQLRIGCTSAALSSNIQKRNIRANPEDWTQLLWKGGTLALSGLLHVGSSGSFAASDIPRFLDSIELASGQRLYECRLLNIGTATTGTNLGFGLVSLDLTYSFLTYSSPSSTLAFGTDGTDTSATQVLNRWLPSYGARGYVDTSSGRFRGFHLASCSINYDYTTLEAPSFPTAIPVYEGGSMKIRGLADNPSLNMCAVDFNWLEHVVPRASGSAVEARLENAVLSGQSASVVMLAGFPVMFYEMSFLGTLVTDGLGSNAGDYYYQ